MINNIKKKCSNLLKKIAGGLVKVTAVTVMLAVVITCTLTIQKKDLSGEEHYTAYGMAVEGNENRILLGRTGSEQANVLSDKFCLATDRFSSMTNAAIAIGEENVRMAMAADELKSRIMNEYIETVVDAEPIKFTIVDANDFIQDRIMSVEISDGDYEDNSIVMFASGNKSEMISYCVTEGLPIEEVVVSTREEEIAKRSDVLSAVNLNPVVGDDDKTGNTTALENDKSSISEKKITTGLKRNDDNRDKEFDRSDDLVYKYNKKMKRSVSDEEYEVLCRIVEAEAGDQDVYGRILVANVILNRVKYKKEFANDIIGVVFEKNQFAPTRDGSYYSVKVSDTTMEAVDRCLNGEDYSQGALYFFMRSATSKTKAAWFDSLNYLFKYGCHEFFK